ncbi:hypothetical protein [Acaryochloris marina]|uniref:Uncharacterized protein n=1 Tax=Acaryochloris marina (strain MBIC 11017) TaxID=329726 RepID=B0CF74_ACAM1|nr:hypothetical protein [Acaryochloris marina]ABW30590.1 hypothetical protein AM1_5640 [Acaryochloris marina MBIC11017]BDM79388.1 hypothetical protein AM10699_22560 [Acaryochloris marina MBIC10699]
MFLEKTRHYFRSATQRLRVSLEPWQEAALGWIDQNLQIIADRDDCSTQGQTEQIAIAFCTVSAK